MSDGDALLRTILEHPDDDTARLVYADWLEEHGQAERAGFMRAQVKGEPVPKRPNRITRLAIGESGGAFLEWTNGSGKRDRAITAYSTTCGVAAYSAFTLANVERNRQRNRVLLARGFVAEITCPLDVFQKHAPALFAAHPIERVTLTDIRPTPVTTDDERPEWTYFIGTIDTGYHLPQEIYFQLWGEWRHSREAALNALSQACVAYGRERAGLKALPRSEPK